MKKLFVLFALLGFLTFTTAACGGGGETEATTEDSTSNEEPTDKTAEPEVEVEPVQEDSTVTDTTKAEKPAEEVKK